SSGSDESRRSTHGRRVRSRHPHREPGEDGSVCEGVDRHEESRALTAGWGDILVAVTAIPLAWAIHRGPAASGVDTAAPIAAMPSGPDAEKMPAAATPAITTNPTPPANATCPHPVPA